MYAESNSGTMASVFTCFMQNRNSFGKTRYSDSVLWIISFYSDSESQPTTAYEYYAINDSLIFTDFDELSLSICSIVALLEIDVKLSG